jgi:SAM-dependent methyltransferase
VRAKRLPEQVRDPNRLLSRTVSAAYAASVSDAYQTGAYAQANPDWHEGDAPHKAAVLAEVARSLGWSPATVVDVGCGVGAVLESFVAALRIDRSDLIGEGWDPSVEAIRRAQTRASESLRFVCGDFLAQGAPAELALCVDVVEHVPDDLAFLTALRDRADRFLFRIPLDLSALDLLRPHRLLDARRTLLHRHVYTRELALELLARAGYHIEHVRYDRVPPARDTLRRRVVDAVRRASFARLPVLTVRALGGWSLVVAATPDQSTAKR